MPTSRDTAPAARSEEQLWLVCRRMLLLAAKAIDARCKSPDLTIPERIFWRDMRRAALGIASAIETRYS